MERRTAVLQPAPVADEQYPLAERDLRAAFRFHGDVGACVLAIDPPAQGRHDFRYLALVHEALGARHIAGLLRGAHRDLCVPLAPAARRARLRALDAAVAACSDPLEELLACYVRGAGPQPGRATPPG
jgi:hypothetical protein